MHAVGGAAEKEVKTFVGSDEPMEAVRQRGLFVASDLLSSAYVGIMAVSVHSELTVDRSRSFLCLQHRLMVILRKSPESRLWIPRWTCSTTRQ
jgi:hypothetical protein